MTETSEGVAPTLFQASPEQIKNRNRVRDLAEVYTHHREVTAMLDLVPDMFPSEEAPDNLDKTFLEPAAGHGNFLVEILRRKLAAVAPARYRGEEYEHRILRCLASIYGIDIDPENVTDSRRHMRSVIATHIGDPASRTAGFWSAVDAILTTNIVRADTLADAQVIELVSYQPGAAGTFLRKWSTLEEPALDSQQWEPDFDKRRKHIYRDMLFGTSITQMTGMISRRSVYCARDASSELSVVRFDDPDGNLPFVAAPHRFIRGRCTVCGAPESLEREGRENHAYSFIHDAYPTKEMKDMKFDIIVTNPPYQLSTEGYGATASTIYHRFVEMAISMNPRYLLMITPSRWFAGGKGLNDFRDRMINDRHIAKMVDNPKIFDCFPGVKIRGGVSYFLWDREHDGDCEFTTKIEGKVVSVATRDLRGGDGVLVRDNRAVPIVKKVQAKMAEDKAASAESRCTVTKPFGLTMRSNYKGSVAEPFEGAIPLIYNNRIGYSRPDQIQRNHQWIDRWKVLLPMASSGDTPIDEHGRIVDVVLGEPIALAPGSACTQTYFIVGMFDTSEETENYAHYLATKFVRFLVLQRKTTQHVTPDRFRFVPMLDMTRRWTDDDLYAHFALTDDEIDYIESSIKPRSVNLSLDSPIPASHLPGGYKYRVSGTDEADESDDDIDDEADE